MSSRIKVAFMSHVMDNRAGKGTALYTRRLIEELLKNDRLEITLVHYEKTDDPLYKKAREILIPRLRLPFATRFVRTLLFFWKYRRERFDIIHWFQPRLYPFFWFAPARRIVVTAHGAGDITAPGQFPLSRSIYNFLMIHFNHRIDAIIGVSEFGKQEIIEHYRATRDNVYAIYNGGGESFKPLYKQASQKLIFERYGIRSPFILDVSRLEPHKNVDTLIRAYEILRRENTFSHSLVIVGARRFEAEKTLALAHASLYAKDIMFLDFVEQADLNALYSASDVFVFPSLNEGFGLPLVEAFSSGTPVITSNVTALPEVASDAAIIVDPADTSALAGAMCRVLSDARLRNMLVQKGLARARVFTWIETARKTSDLYQHLVDHESVR
ncbi:MAG: glycosyltransferase family 1 protein [Patescibacteria group bacterium]